MFLKKNTTDMGILGSLLRYAVLLIFVIYFAVPLLWLLIAPSRDTTQITNNPNSLAFGSVERLVTSWQNIMSYNGGEAVLWLGNSVKY